MATALGAPRRILIISTTFFPDPMVAALRMTQWCRYLPHHGWTTDIACRHYGFAATRKLLDEKVHSSANVHYLTPESRTDVADHGRAASRLLHRIEAAAIRLLYSPDVSARFWKANSGRIVDLVRQLKPDAVLTTAPPYGVHCAGQRVAEETGVPWIADFREAFIADPRYRPRGLAQLQWPNYVRYERDIYSKASLIIHQLPVHERWARRRYAFARDKCVTMINGFSDELIDGTIQPSLSLGGRKSIRVIGTCMDDDALRLARIVADFVAGGSDLELRFVGRVPTTLAQMQQLLGDRVIACGYLRFDHAIAETLGADVLVNYLSQERQTGLIISTKLIEYLATGKPVLEINATRSDRLFAGRWPQVRTVNDRDTRKVARALHESLHTPAPVPEEMSRRFREQFLWSKQAQKVASWLDAVVERRPICR